jgi:hypothetical protein
MKNEEKNEEGPGQDASGMKNGEWRIWRMKKSRGRMPQAWSRTSVLLVGGRLRAQG